MNSFRLSLRGGITFAFVLISLLVLALAVANYLQLRQVQPYSDVIYSDSSSMSLLQRMTAANAALDVDLERYLTLRSSEYHDNSETDLQGLVDALRLLQADPKMRDKPQVTELDNNYAQMMSEVKYLLMSEAIGASAENINRQIVAAYKNIGTTKQLLGSLTASTLADLQSTAAAQSQIANTVQTRSMILSLIVLFTAVLSTLAVNWRLAGITRLTQVATGIASGDLTREAPEGRKDEIGTLGVAFNAMTSRLREMVVTLEQRVADRTQAIATSSEVSRRLSTILDQKQLALAVVEEVQRAFKYYHAHIYLFDEFEENLVMVGGTGEAGQLMLSRGHQIAKGRGLVGRAAETNQVVLVPDTHADPNWLPNPLLPDTQSEIAVPISAGGRVAGVLDVQHNIINGLGQQDADLLQSIANQVAVAVQNATLFTRTQHLAEREALVNAIGQKIQTASSVEGVLQVLARELGAALKVQRVLVQVGGNPTDDNTGKG